MAWTAPTLVRGSSVHAVDALKAEALQLKRQASAGSGGALGLAVSKLREAKALEGAVRRSADPAVGAAVAERVMAKLERTASEQHIAAVAAVELTPADLADDALLGELAVLQAEDDVIADEGLSEELDRSWGKLRALMSEKGGIAALRAAGDAAAEDDAAASYREYEQRFAIGRGQFGVVFLLQHATTHHKVVDKRVGLAGLTPKQRAETDREISLLKSLRHHGIVQYLASWLGGDGGTDGSETLHIIMEYCGGGSLAEAIESQQQMGGAPFAPNRVRRWLKQLAAALAHVHSQRVIHRDVKTANIFLTEGDDSVKLGDFGISRLLSSQTELAATCVGTPYYLSPELISGQGYDGRTDVWSLGVIAHECVALSRPFSGENISQLAMAVVREPPAPLPPTAPQDIAELVAACLQKEAGLRPTAARLLASPPMARWDDDAEGGGGQGGGGGATEVPYVGEEQSIETPRSRVLLHKDSPRAEVMRGAAAAAAVGRRHGGGRWGSCGECTGGEAAARRRRSGSSSRN